MNIRQLEKELQMSYDVQNEMLEEINKLKDELKFAVREIRRLAADKIKLENSIQKIKATRLIFQKGTSLLLPN